MPASMACNARAQGAERARRAAALRVGCACAGTVSTAAQLSALLHFTPTRCSGQPCDFTAPLGSLFHRVRLQALKRADAGRVLCHARIILGMRAAANIGWPGASLSVGYTSIPTCPFHAHVPGPCCSAAHAHSRPGTAHWRQDRCHARCARCPATAAGRCAKPQPQPRPLCCCGQQPGAHTARAEQHAQRAAEGWQ